MRPEKLKAVRSQDGAKRIGEVLDVLYLGSIHKLVVQLEDEPMTVSIVLDFTDERPWQVGERVGVNWNTEDEVVIGP
ncbi:TOBE domain protein [compost metagenome]